MIYCPVLHRYCDSSDYRSNDDSDQTVAAQIRYAFEDLFYQYNVRAAPPFLSSHFLLFSAVICFWGQGCTDRA